MKIIALTNYKGNFGSKHFDTPYRSGFDKNKIKQYFSEKGFEIIYRNFSEMKMEENLKDYFLIYTSSEDIGYYYKSFIEDIILGCELNGARTIPCYKYLRANNNKVFMEILRKQASLSAIKNLKSRFYGTLEELENDNELKRGTFPKVLKLAEGASGKNVMLVKSYDDLIIKIKRYCRTENLYYDCWDYGRSLLHKGYIRESLYRKKFIVQDFIPDLVNDWKIYIFYNHYFIFYRPIFKERVFKASGGGYDNYLYGVNAKIPDGIFDFAESIRNEFSVPHLSLDIAFNGKEFYLLEFQFVYFGTAGIPYSNEYFIRSEDKWVSLPNPKDQEYFYVNSIIDYINDKNFQ